MELANGEEVPVVEFFLLYKETRPPEPASRDVLGSLPARAARVCPPVTTASAFGWYVYPPMDFALRWDGQLTEWSMLVDNEPVEWQSLAGGIDAPLPIAQQVADEVLACHPADKAVFDSYGGVPTFINVDPRGAHTMEITTGLLARTPPGWCLLARGVPNFPHSRDHQILDGVVESAWFRSYVPTIVRLTSQDRVVRFYRDAPIMVVQPVPQVALAAGRGKPVVHRGVREIPDDVWAEFVAWRQRRDDPDTSHVYLNAQRQVR